MTPCSPVYLLEVEMPVCSKEIGKYPANNSFLKGDFYFWAIVMTFLF